MGPYRITRNFPRGKDEVVQSTLYICDDFCNLSTQRVNPKKEFLAERKRAMLVEQKWIIWNEIVRVIRERAEEAKRGSP